MHPLSPIGRSGYSSMIAARFICFVFSFASNAIIFFVLGSCYAGGIFSEDLSKALPTDGEPDVIRINRKHYEALIKRHYGSIHSYKAQGITLSASPKAFAYVRYLLRSIWKSHLFARL